MISLKLTVLGKDPNTVHRLNANAFQQDTITTFRNHQYAAHYTAAANPRSVVRHVTLARRELSAMQQSWEFLTLEDYDQTTDDGHNTISIGICAGDGTIHLSFDHHCDDLRFRRSISGLALHPNAHKWDASLFEPVQNCLPGLNSDAFRSISYPRFIRAGHDLLFEARTGKAGAGSDILFVYSGTRQNYVARGTYLVGINNNPYVNGLTFSNGRLHVSWTYRDFLEYEGSHDPDNQAHKSQAGPNGPENNFDLNYAYSDDMGLSWSNTTGKKIAQSKETGGDGVGLARGILPSASDIIVQHIPKGSGIMNQESQCIGPETHDFHVLNRDSTSGNEQWRHYLRDSKTGEWTTADIPSVYPTETGSRGCIASNASGTSIYFMFPGNTDTSLTLMRRSKTDDDYSEFEFLWRGEGFEGEPNIDRERLIHGDGVLSAFTRTAGCDRDVVVLDFVI